MSRPDDPADVNPYAAPAAVDDQWRLETTPHTRALLQQFRSQMHGLAVMWLLVGVVLTAISFLFLSGQIFVLRDTPLRIEVMLGLISLTSGGLWLVAGLMTLYKQLWAVYLGLVGSYLALLLFVVVAIGSFSPGTLIPIMFFGIAIVQSHRVIGWAKELLICGVSLTARP